jgi:hypothetical protein
MPSLVVTILICASGLPPRYCTDANAIAVLKPNASLYEARMGAAACGSFAQQYAASLHYLEPGPDGKPVAYVKSRCDLQRSAG